MLNASLGVSLACALAMSAWAQNLGVQLGPKGLLTTPVIVSGIVVDSTGQPIADVRIDHLSLADLAVDQAPTSTGQGLFRVETRAPAVVFRKDGYVGRFVRTQELQNLRVVMQTASPGRQLPRCSKSGNYVSLGQGMFAVPKLKEIVVGKLGGSIDAVERSFSIRGMTKVSTMVHGTGTSWGGAIPRTMDVWASQSFGEEQLKAKGQPLIDAHGETAEGKFWRSIARPGESVFYSDVDEHAALIFDKVLDGLCVQ